MPNLWTYLSDAVEKHEGSVSGATSHFLIHRGADSTTATEDVKRRLQNRWWRGSDLLAFYQIGLDYGSAIHAEGRPQHVSLDSALSASSQTIANCTWNI